MASYFFQLAIGLVFLGHPLLAIIRPMGAVLKKGSDQYSLIAKAW
jgi:hypothetical protein